MKFTDYIELKVTSGKGGAGSTSFLRERGNPRGGPDGGNGGRGGNICVQASPGYTTLVHLKGRSVFQAEHGEGGGSQQRTGKNGEDLVIDVPLGTTVVNKLTGEKIIDLKSPDKYTLLQGGIGGKGNCFYKSSINQAPEYAQKGMPSEHLEIAFELRSIADVGLVGLPNAGKSTLLSVISAAKPRVADYPFTTLVPQLGVVKVDDKSSFVMADIPGLIEGAHEGRGLGLKFLKHIERTKLFVHMVDGSNLEDTPYSVYKKIRNELKYYDEKYFDQITDIPLSERTSILVINKVDQLSPELKAKITIEFKNNGIEPFFISALTGQNTRALVYKINELVIERKLLESRVDGLESKDEQ